MVFGAENWLESALVKFHLVESEFPYIEDSNGRKLRIDFNSNKKDYHKKKSTLTAEPLSRALGAGKKGLRVLDLSAGLGVDAVFLAQLGYTVTALERNPMLYFLLNKALENWQSEDKIRLKFIFSEALTYLQEAKDEFDICYFDPMFPQKSKSALPKQEMVIFKELVGQDNDAADVLANALQSKRFKRCVIKRPLRVEPLLADTAKPSGCIEGKIIRYDIYG